MQKCEKNNVEDAYIFSFSFVLNNNTDFNNYEELKTKINYFIDMYDDEKVLDFYNSPFFKNIVTNFIKGTTSLTSSEYRSLIDLCKTKIKAKWKPSDLLINGYKYIIKHDITVDDETFSNIVNIYTYIGEILPYADTYIQQQLILNRNNLPKYIYINLMQTLGEKIYSTLSHKDRTVILKNTVNGEILDNVVGKYSSKTTNISLNVKYLNSKNIVKNIRDLFHEIYHHFNYHQVDKDSYIKYEIQKEILLTKLLDDYDQNYYVSKDEYYAESNANDTATYYIKRICPSYPLAFDRDIYQDSELRVATINGKKMHTSLDQLFELIIQNDSEVFSKIYKIFSREYNANASRKLISEFLIDRQQAKSDEEKQFYDDLIYKHMYSHKEILINLKDLFHKYMLTKDDKYLNVVLSLINSKIVNGIKHKTHLKKQSESTSLSLSNEPSKVLLKKNK